MVLDKKMYLMVMMMMMVDQFDVEMDEYDDVYEYDDDEATNDEAPLANRSVPPPPPSTTTTETIPPPQPTTTINNTKIPLNYSISNNNYNKTQILDDSNGKNYIFLLKRYFIRKCRWILLNIW